MRSLKVTFKAIFDPSIMDAWKTISEEKIDHLNWPLFPYQPEANFRIVHDGEMLFIRFNVKEKYPIRCVCSNDQEPVYQDSCVEFFILDKIGLYHNFEFNAKGFCLSSKGKTRQGRINRSPKELNKILRLPSQVIKSDDSYYWTLTIGIPFVTMGVSRGNTFGVNFYKCGDLTEEKHYLSWNKINTYKPDFHCPEHFGKMLLE